MTYTPCGRTSVAVTTAALMPRRFFLGLGSTITCLGLKYGSEDSIKFTDDVSREMAVAGWEAGLPPYVARTLLDRVQSEVRRVIEFLQGQMGAQSIRFPATSAIGNWPDSLHPCAFGAIRSCANARTASRTASCSALW